MKHPLKIVAPVSVALLLVACGPREEAAQPIVFSLEQTSRSATAEAALDSNADQKMAGDMMMVPVSTTYVASGDLPALDGKAPSWKSDSSPTKKEMRRIADALGVEGDLEQQPDEMGGGYVVGPTDGSAPVVSFSNGTYDAFHSWWYSPMMETTPRTAESVAPDSSGSTTSSDAGEVPASDVTVIEEPIREPEKPENLPSKDEARALVEDVAQRAGFAIDEIEVQADEWGVWATGWQTLDGMRSPFAWNFGFGANSELTYAYGHLLDFAEAASFPRVGTTVGVERLSDPKYSGWYGYGAVARDAAVATEPAPAVVETDGTGSDTKEATVPAPETVEVSLTGVKESLMSVVDADGAVWLLPAYEYDTADGYSVSTLAITDEFIVQEEPTTDTVVDGVIEPMPGDTGGGSSGGEGSSPGSPGSAGDSEIVPPTEADAAALVGLSEDEALKVIASRGWTSRVGSRDGEDFMLTTDYSETRLTLSIEQDNVTNAVIG
jgi:hypothetical protein